MNLFKGFQLELASDFTGLSLSEIRHLREANIVKPDKTKEGYCYSFQDLLMLRLVKLLKLYGVKLKNIERAHQYLQSIDPSKKLTSYKLYIRTDSHQILYLGEQPQDNTLVSLDQFGQLMTQNVLIVLPVGEHLEGLRKRILTLDSDLTKRINTKKVIPLNKVLKRYEHA